MPNYIFNREITVHSPDGVHGASFLPGVPTPVPPALEHAVISAGGVIQTGDKSEPVSEAPVKEKLEMAFKAKKLQPGESGLDSEVEETVDVEGAPEVSKEVEEVEPLVDDLPEPEVPENVAVVVSAMENVIAEDNPELLTSNGIPRVNEIQSRLGRDTTKEERDAAWAIVEG